MMIPRVKNQNFALLEKFAFEDFNEIVSLELYRKKEEREFKKISVRIARFFIIFE